MEPEIRLVAPDELSHFERTLEVAAGRLPGRDPVEHARVAHPDDRTFAVFDGAGRVIGGTSSDLLELTLPGLVVVPAARAALTAVVPTHRGTGLASRLLTHQLHDCAARGEALAIATTSAPGLLRAVGYGPATVAIDARIDLPAAAPTPNAGIRLLDGGEADAVLPAIFEQHRSLRPGQVARSAAFWRAWFKDDELYRIGPSERFAVVLEDESGCIQGYLTYRLAYGDLRRQPIETLVIEDIVDTCDAARAALWRFALGFSQARVLHAPNVAPDEALPWLLDDPRSLRSMVVRDFLWLRILDVASALASRRYAVPGRLSLAVRDAALAANNGTFTLVVDGPTVRCERSAEPPDLTIEIGDLATAFLGRTTFATLAAAGRVVEHADGAAISGSLMFFCSPQAWTVTDW